MSLSHAMALLLGYTMAVCAVYDLVFGRADRRARRAAETHARQLLEELERRDRGDMVRHITPTDGPDPSHEPGTGRVVPLRSRPGPRRRSRAAHPSTFHREGA